MQRGNTLPIFTLQVKSCKHDKRIMHVNISERYRMGFTTLVSVWNTKSLSKQETKYVHYILLINFDITGIIFSSTK